MFAIYAFNASASKGNILSDIVALLTGEITKSNLSAACNQTDTTIYSGYDAAGWTVHDNGVGTDKIVLKAPCVDGGLYKYVGFDYSDGANLKFGGAETWDNSTHAGTNMILAAGTTNIYVTTFYSYTSAAAGYLFIYATNRGFIIYNNQTPNIINCLEFDRSGLFMEIGNGFPCWGINSNNQSYPAAFQLPRASGISSATPEVATSYPSFGISWPRLSNASTRLGKNSIKNLSDVPTYSASNSLDSVVLRCSYGYYSSYSVMGKPLLEYCLCLVGNLLDEFTANGKTYIAIVPDNLISHALDYDIALKVWVPKG